jgi:AraC-like DNA-binding protein
MPVRQDTAIRRIAMRACPMAALPRPGRGERVTTIAVDLGYASPAGFTTMFKAMIGTTPQAYRTQAGETR